MQATQLPALQTMLVPQTVPFGASPDSMQTGVPVLQAMVPLRQGLPGTTQSMPGAQAAHAPVAPQTMSVPHDVPAATFVLVSVHAAPRPSRPASRCGICSSACRRRPPGRWRTSPPGRPCRCRSAVPFGLLSVSVQTGAPVVQTMLPTRQGLPVTSQAMPATHASQLPLWQTLSVSQTVPFACRSVSSMQDIAPSLQTNMPL